MGLWLATGQGAGRAGVAVTDMTTSPYGRDACPVCGRDIALKKNGRMRQHGRKQDVGRFRSPMCLGTGAKPAPQRFGW